MKSKKKIYNLASEICVNSFWPAKWLTKGECCQCPFECKVKISTEHNYFYIITESEYKKLKRIRKI